MRARDSRAFVIGAAINQAPLFDAILAGVQTDIGGDEAEEESQNYLLHSAAQRTLKRMAVENAGWQPRQSA